jgi:hypothetical protein
MASSTRFLVNKFMVRTLPRIKEQKITITRNPGRIIGLILTILGLTPIIIALSNAWASGISFLNLTDLYEFLWANRFNAGFGIQFALIYLFIAGMGIIILGVFMIARKTEHIEEVTVVAEDLTVTLKCTNCSYRWKEEFSKAQLNAMGFPQNRTISRRRCPDCRIFTRPKIIQI